jgi:outer membrane protein assembly factor BamE
VLARIEGEGLSPINPPTIAKPAEQTAVAAAKPPVVPESVPLASPVPPAPIAKPAVDGMAAAATPVPEPATTTVTVNQADRRLDETSIVPPLRQPEVQPAEATAKPASVTDRPPESVALQTEANVEAVKPDVMPAFPDAPQPAQTQEEQVLAAMNAWAQAWRVRDEDAYIAAYASSFRPQGGLSRAEWEKRRRLLLGLSRNIDLKLDSASAEIQGEKRALVTFNQFYSSDSYQDAVIKQLKFVLVDGRWLIEEEKVLGPLKIKK